jgi:hypothetical protein
MIFGAAALCAAFDRDGNGVVAASDLTAAIRARSICGSAGALHRDP